MKITSQIIRSRSGQSSLQSIQYLNLSHLEIYVLEKLNSCGKLQTLEISHNFIESISTHVEQCPQLWSINISNNKVQCLDGLSRFVAIGMLDLSNNQLSWSELAKLQHLHILDLRLHGNVNLEKEPYYRTHVIDCLPNVWMLDGRLITSAERIQVKAFFDDSAVSERPVRHRLPIIKGFVPSTQKNREIHGIFGEKAIHLMSRFPKQDSMNIDLDRRRLWYLAENIAQDILLPSASAPRRHPTPLVEERFLIELLEARKVDALRCNMFIMLLLTSLEFKIPDNLFMDTMELMKLNKFGNVNTMKVFTLPRETRALITGVLLSAVKVERVEKQTGGLYDKLYLSMNYLLTECIKSCAGKSSPIAGLYRRYRSLVAAEVVLLMCYVPSFADYIQKEPGVMSLATAATSDSHVISNVSTLKTSLAAQNVTKSEQIRAIGQFIQSAVIYNLAKVPEKTAPCKTESQEHKIFSKRPLPKRPMSGPVFSSTYHMKGKTSPDRNPPRIASAKPKRAKQPDVGETVLTSPQCLARVVSLPQDNIALVLLEMIPVNGGMKSKAPSFEEQYAYIDTNELVWDTAKSYWRPRGTAGNRVTLHYVQDDEVTSETPSQLDEQSVIVCHHSLGAGRVTPITVPLPAGDCQEFMVNTDRPQQDLLSVRPHRPESAPAPSPVQSPMPVRRRTPSAKTAEVIVSKDDPGDNNNNNTSAVEPVETTETERLLTNSPLFKQTNQMSVIEIGTSVPPARLIPSPRPLDQGEHSNSAAEQTADDEGALNEETKNLSLDTSAEYAEDDSESDEEELSVLAREDLIRDTLSNTDLETSISERNIDIAPRNSPDMRAVYSGASNLTSQPSRQPSATINSVYKMLRAEESYKAPTFTRPHTLSRQDEVYTPYLRARAEEWDLRILDPDCTPNVSVRWANTWLGGGRDLHSEEMEKRPTSAHVPGWRDGLKGTKRMRSAHTTRYVPNGRTSRMPANRHIHTSQGSSTYDRELAHQQYKFLPRQTSYRSSYLSSKDNMRNKRQLQEMQREVAWTEYVKNAMLHRAL